MSRVSVKGIAYTKRPVVAGEREGEHGTPPAENVRRRVLLSSNASALLDAARAFAAFYVLLHHVSGQFHLSQAASLPFRFGQEAVILFFLISGFVIHANECERALQPRGYYLRRLRRIYPVLIAAMVVSVAVALDNGDFFSRFKFSEMIGTLLGLQDIAALKPGVIVEPFLGNAPLWSLSYEMAFYAAYPLVLRAFVMRPAATTQAVGLASTICFAIFVLAPSHLLLVAAYFVIWWTGAMAADAYAAGACSWRALQSPLAYLLIMAVLALGAIALRGFYNVGVYPALMLRHFVIAGLMSVLAFGPIGGALSRLAGHLTALTGPAAGIAFGVYALHYPLMIQWNRPSGLMGGMVALALLLTLAWLVERGLPQLLPAALRD